jgi:Leucine Rich repeat
MGNSCIGRQDTELTAGTDAHTAGADAHTARAEAIMQNASFADDPVVGEAIQDALADESVTELALPFHYIALPLTAGDARRIMDCLQNNPRLRTFDILGFRLSIDALNVICNALPLCTSVATVKLCRTQLEHEHLERLLPAFHNTCVTSLDLDDNYIQGHRGGDVLCNLLVGNNNVITLSLERNPLGPEGAIGLGRGLFSRNTRLQQLYLWGCSLGNDGLANLLLLACAGDGMMNNSLTDLGLGNNNIEGATGGCLVKLLLMRFPQLKVLGLSRNNLGPLGACALAPGLAAACHLKELLLSDCGLGNDGVAGLVPDGHVNRSLTRLMVHENNIRLTKGTENLLALAARCTNLDTLEYDYSCHAYDQRRRFGLLLERKRLVTAAQALGDAPASVVFEKLVKTNAHEHGLSATFLILRDHIFAEEQQQTRR